MDKKQRLNNIFAENFRYYLKATNKTQKDIIKDLGYSSAIVSEWATAKKYPRMDRIQTLADYLGIEKYNLIEDAAIQKKIYHYHVLSDDSNSAFEVQDPNNAYTHLTIFEMQDNSMSPEIHEKDLLWIEACKKIKTNSFMLIELNKKKMIRKIDFNGGHVSVQAINDTYPSLSLKINEFNEKITIIGIVKKLKRSY